MKDIVEKYPVIAIIRNISDSDIACIMQDCGALRYLSVMGMP